MIVLYIWLGKKGGEKAGGAQKFSLQTHQKAIFPKFSSSLLFSSSISSPGQQIFFLFFLIIFLIFFLSFFFSTYYFSSFIFILLLFHLSYLKDRRLCCKIVMQ